MSEFEREERYVVLKLKHMSDDVKKHLFDAVLAGDGFNQFQTECVVVEADWPIYEQVWHMVQLLSEGKNTTPLFDEYLLGDMDDLKAENQQLQASNKELLEALERLQRATNPLAPQPSNAVAAARLSAQSAITNATQRG